MKEAILFLTHKKNAGIIRELEKLNREKGSRELYILSQERDFSEVDIPVIHFDDSVLINSGYPLMGDSIVPGHAHIPFFQWFMGLEDEQRPDYCWLIEYDVRFTGNWSKLFDYYANDDSGLITSHIRWYSDEPDWCWWRLEHPEVEIETSRRLKSLNPVYRFSSSAISYLHNSFIEGWQGHNEVIIPTLLYHGGYRLTDLGQGGDFRSSKPFCITRNDRHGRQNAGTMRYRPVMKEPGLRPNMIYHPVKKEGQGKYRAALGGAYRTMMGALRS
jgi:hypothetical protein